MDFTLVKLKPRHPLLSTVSTALCPVWASDSLVSAQGLFRILLIHCLSQASFVQTLHFRQKKHARTIHTYKSLQRLAQKIETQASSTVCWWTQSQCHPFRKVLFLTTPHSSSSSPSRSLTGKPILVCPLCSNSSSTDGRKAYQSIFLDLSSTVCFA